MSNHIEEEEEYDVECILQHRVINNKYEFLVQWLGYDHSYDLWIHQEDFGSVETLNNYCRDFPNWQPLKDQDRVQGVILSDARVTGFSKNYSYLWRTSSICDQYRKRFLPHIPRSIRIIHSWTDLPNVLTIFLCNYLNHLYVVLYNPTGTSYLSDGAGLTSTNYKGCLQWAEKKFKTNLTVKRYASQTGDDHCSSSGIMIALHFLRYSQNLEILENLPVLLGTPSIVTELRKMMHPDKSKSLISQYSINNHLLTSLRCPKCDLSFANKHRSKRQLLFNRHVKYCSN